ncbi:class I SAM-dependent methyltransferase [Lentisphaera marina]|uniref:class I SAM-dependent methyltransferase n=1 Tax=Lentisphaera marina TaxID=1111041 RepID=UPI00236542BE|nr:class I SAM-dependent methyltransferase [Lentisphaera marina]MDD7985739.1 class I SAM-dependent methyltransferase [Lentisphaera marina]
MSFKCRVCDSVNMEPVIDLGIQPWCNDFLTPEQVGKEPSYPLNVVYCHQCTTAQLDYTVPKEVMFGDHTYLSGITKSLSDHFKKMAIEANDRFCENKDEKSVLDIGSNDGTQLQHYKKLGFDILGVESSVGTATIANERGLKTINAFYNLETAKEMGKKFDIINASGVFFHLEELHSVVKAVKFNLNEDGVLIVQFLYMKSIVENCAFDQIYHEHLLYYSLKTLKTLLNRHGLDIFDAYLAPIHGGSVMAFVSHTESNRPKTERYQAMVQEEEECDFNSIKTYKDFNRRIQAMKQENLAFLRSRKAEGKKIFGLGAPVKGNTMLNFFGVNTDLLDCLTEKNKLRDGLYSPGMHIPIVMEDEHLVHPDVYYVLAWNFKKEILKNNQNLIDQGIEFFFPVDPEEL